jgi:epoxyqueuosine reductase
VLTADAIKAKARQLGFDLCGIAPVDNFPELTFLEEWLAHGYAGEMAYMARSAERRADVRNVVPGARSVIVTGTIYATESESGDAPTHVAESHCESGHHLTPTRASIARYARGDDYHDVLQNGSTRAGWDARGIVSAPPTRVRRYGPVQERVYAAYAGLGWIGKNTCLINAEHGSWLFLSEIITTLSLDADTQALEQCGSCRRCLDACPTGALVDSGVLDSTRCISYLTIELRTRIPDEYRAAIGNHVYGCDICQDVCPHNQPASVSADMPWQPRKGLDLPGLVELWQRPDGDLRALLKGSAMTRAKLTGLRRNLAVAIGNSGDADALAVLQERRADQPSAADPMVAEHIDWAIARGRGRPPER